MSEVKTIDVKSGNQIIAEFMGWTSYTSEAAGMFSSITYWKNPETGRVVYFHPDRYHISWDELMPVVEKISRIVAYKDENQEATFYPRTFGMLSDEGKPMVRLNACPLFIADTLIEAAYNAVVDFIKWHNEQ